MLTSRSMFVEASMLTLPPAAPISYTDWDMTRASFCICVTVTVASTPLWEFLNDIFPTLASYPSLGAALKV